MDKNQEFSGTIRYLSVSPHGDVEGLVLDDGTFVKTPPHSLQKQELFEVGSLVTGRGQLLCEDPNMVFHHAQVSVGDELAADDSLDKYEKEKLKEQHKKDLKTRKDAPSKDIKAKGKLVAIGTKPKGEVDRMIFADGTSVHLAKEVGLTADDVAIGETFEVVGEARIYGKNRFIKAENVKRVN